MCYLSNVGKNCNINRCKHCKLYNIFQELTKMSLLQLLHNNPTASQLLFGHCSALKALQQQNVLKILSLALTKSLNNYQIARFGTPLPQAYQSGRSPASMPAEEGQKAAVIEILSDGEQPSVGYQQKLNFKQPVRAQLTPIIPNNLPSLADRKSSEASPTSPENHSEDSLRKPKSKKVKKDKSKKHLIDYQVKEPQIDELETCRLPEMQMNRAMLQALREGLLMRQVDEWGVDPRKQQKREIRMLSN